jgi:hypothetical protein
VLPLLDGGALIAAGAWLFALEASGEVRARARIDHEALETFVWQGRVLALEETGELVEWDGSSAPRVIADFGAPVLRAALGDDGTLIAVVSGRGLFGLGGARTSTEPRTLAADPSVLGLLALADPGHALALRGDGRVLAAALTEAAAPLDGGTLAQPGTITRLLASPSAIAWIGRDTALELRDGESERELGGVHCHEPMSLAVAGAGRVLVGCQSGQLWLISQAPTNSVPVQTNPAR